jgi:uncharacterized membrane protein
MSEELEPVMEQKSAAEKEASAYWFRQINTALALGNAGGIVTLAGFAGNTDNLKLAALITYPAISYFLTGVSFAFVAFGLQFVYSTLRLEEYAELNERQIQWRQTRGMPARINWLATAAFFIYWPLQFGALCASGFYFYNGAGEVSGQTGALHCAIIPNSDACSERPTLILNSPSKTQAERVRSIPNLTGSDQSDRPAAKVTFPEKAPKPAPLPIPNQVPPPSEKLPREKAQVTEPVLGSRSSANEIQSSSHSSSEHK